MLDNLEPIVRDAVMKILSAVYETGFVEEVNLGVVYALFGVNVEGEEDTIVDFSSDDWVRDYVKFTQGIPDDADFNVVRISADEDLPEVLRGHLQALGISEEDIEDITTTIAEDIAEHEGGLSQRGPGPDESVH